MANKLFTGLSSLLLPLGLYGVPAQSSTSYQRSYLSASISAASVVSATTMAAGHLVRDAVTVDADELDIASASPVKELVIIDAAVPDKQVFYRGVKPGVDIVEIDSSASGLAQLTAILAGYKNLTALHIVSHAEDGVLHLGSSRVDAAMLKQEVETFAALQGALVAGADLLLYGCDLASGEKGDELLEVIRSNTHLDVAASTNKTGNAEQDGDWELEVQQGDITAALAFSEKSLRDFSAVLAPTEYDSRDFCWGPGAPYYGAGGMSDSCTASSLASQDNKLVFTSSPGSAFAGGPAFFYSSFTNFLAPGNTSGWVQFTADGTNLSGFTLSRITRSYSQGYGCMNVSITGTRKSDGNTVTDTLSGAAVPYGDSVYTPTLLANVELTAFRVTWNSCNGDIGYFALSDFTIEAGATNATPTNTVAPAITGTATVGNALTGSDGSWTDADLLTYSRQWYRADDASGTNRTAIASATGATYTLTTNDAHRYIQLEVTANDGNGGTQTANSTYTQVANTAPVNSALPSISGTATVGNALSTTNGTWSDADGDGRTYSYQWYRADDNSGTNVAMIAGANSASYTLTTSDAHKYLRVVVTANDGNGGTTSANSVYTQILNSAPVNSAPPGIIGTAVVGSTLSTSNGTWSDADGDGRTFTYQWYRADDSGGSGLALIAGANSASYTLTASDAQKYLRVVVTANDGYGGTTPANSGYTSAVNTLPSDISLSNNSVAQSGGANASVGTLNTSDPDIGDTFTYTLVAGVGDTHNASFNISGSSLRANDSSALAAGSYSVRIRTTDNANGSFEKVLTVTAVDDVAPVVSSIAPQSGSLPSATTVTFDVSFSEAVTGVSTDDFTLTTTGDAEGTVTNVGGAGATYAVTVNDITGDGVIRLDLKGGTDITDAASNLAAAYTGGTTHTVDRVAPNTPSAPDLASASDSGVSSTDNITNVNTPTMTGIAEANATVQISSSIGGVLGTTTADGSGNWSFTPGVALADGSHDLTATATDNAGNESPASTALNIRIDTTAPTVAIASTDSALIAGETSLVTFTFSEAVTGFTNDDLTIANGTLSEVSSADDGLTWTATFTPDVDVVASTNTISLAVSGVTDIAGNAGVGITSSDNYTIDTLRPAATIVVADTELLAGETSLVTFTFNKTVSGFSNDDLMLANGTLSAVSSANGITWTATFTPTPGLHAPDNAITLDNTGVQDSSGNEGTGSTDSNNFVIRTKPLDLLVTTPLDTDDDESIAASLEEDMADGGGLSLREALAWARNGDTLTFDLDANTGGNQGGTITLNGNQLNITVGNLTVNGDLNNDGTADVIISANNASRVLQVGGNARGVELIGLALTQGATGMGGAGIYLSSNAEVTLRHSNITNNTEAGSGGGGIYGNDTVLTLINSTVSGNTSTTFGGGLRIVGASGQLNLINSSLTGNMTTDGGAHGGGLQYAGSGGLNIINSTISGNAVTGNNALGGGIRITSGTSYIYNSTIAGNAATGTGAGVSADGSSDTFVNTVIAGNTAGAGAAAAVNGSPLATGGIADDVSGTIEVSTNSFFGSSVTITTDNNSLDNQGTSALLLGDLSYNGGSVRSHLPLPGSALIDAGSNAALPVDTFDLNNNSDTAEVLPVDATGKARIAGTAVDIGAVETNSPPTLLDLDGGNTHTEGGTPVVIDADVTVTDDEIDLLNGGLGNYNGASLTLIRNGGANAADIFGFIDGSGIALTAGQLVKNGQAIASFNTSTAGQLAISFTDANGEIPLRADVNSVLQQLTYLTSSNDPAASITLDWTFTDNANASVTGSAPVLIALSNDAPTLTATGATATFTEGGSVAGLFSGTAIDTIEVGQTITQLTLTVTNISDGSDEMLLIDGSELALTHGNSLTSLTNGMALLVSVSNTTATVSMSRTTGISSSAAQTLVNGISYHNASVNPATLNRVVTLTSIRDDGGTANDGTDTSSLAIATTITVVGVNSPPIISGTPAISIQQNALYSFTPTASDVDSPALSFSITNQPAWASFDTTTGTLGGTPGQAHVGTTSGIVISVSDGGLTAALPAFNLTVVDVNDAPIISGTPATSVNQDAAYSFIPTASDVDVGDLLTFSIVNKPSWANFDGATGAMTGTPVKANVGVTSNIVISVSDGTVSTSLPAFNLEVVNVNDAPVISGIPPLVAYVGTAYDFIPTATDADGDTLTFTALGLPAWLTLNSQTGQIRGTPAGSHAGMSYNIALSVSDGVESVTLPPFTLTVEYSGAEPVITPPADITINAAGLYTPISLRQLLSLPPGTSPAAVQDALIELASDSAGGEGCCIVEPQGLLANSIVLPPGRHELVWRATNPDGLTTDAVQVISVRPRVAFGKHQIGVDGTSVHVRVILNGPSPFYPLEIPYTIDPASTAVAGLDHDATDGSVIFTQGQTEVSFTVNLLAGGTTVDSQLIFRLDDNSPRSNEPIPGFDAANPDVYDINSSAADHHIISIVEGNVAPRTHLVMNQAGSNTILVAADNGPVTVTAVVTDPNPGDTHSFDWSSTDSRLSDTDGSATNETFVFDPAGQTGLRRLEVTTTDAAGGVDTSHLHFVIVASSPILNAGTDTDEDGIDDLTEGTSDDDGNGIPAYLDNMPSSNVLPQVIISTTSYLVECDPGLLCSIGQFAMNGRSGGVQVLDDELGVTDGLIADESYDPMGGVFDFTVRDLPIAGQSVRIAIPQQAPIPADAVYRKYIGGQWVNFVENADNTLHSAPGNPGYCPPPGDESWVPGLVQDFLCVQLTIQDGGPNDADGTVNSTVVDPGAVSAAKPVAPPPPPAATPIDTKGKGGGALDWSWLLLLGALLVLRRVHAEKSATLILVVALFSSASQAEDATSTDHQQYLRLNLYQAKGTQGAGDLVSGMASDGVAVTVRDYDVSRFAYRLSWGISWTESTAIEVGYMDLGEVTVNIDTTATDMAVVSASLEQHYPMSADGLTLSHRFGHQFPSGLSLSGEVGIFIWDSRIDTRGGTLDPNKGSGIDPLLGIQLDYRVAEPVSIGLGYQRIFFDGQAVELLGISSSWHF